MLNYKKIKKYFAGNTNKYYFAFQSAFMNKESIQQHSDLLHIKNMMERSSKFISLSGLSGVAAGTCALIGAYFASNVIKNSNGLELSKLDYNLYSRNYSIQTYMGNKLFVIALATFVVSFVLSFLFTWLRSRKTNTPLWGSTSKRVAINMFIPMVAGGLYILKLIEHGAFGLIAPGCLIFYGLALVNASKYTLGEVRYLGVLQIVLGIINLNYVGLGIYFWAAGFGILHIVYGLIMWAKYERN